MSTHTVLICVMVSTDTVDMCCGVHRHGVDMCCGVHKHGVDVDGVGIDCVCGSASTVGGGA